MRAWVGNVCKGVSEVEQVAEEEHKEEMGVLREENALLFRGIAVQDDSVDGQNCN